jgi:hypothetical protein
MGGARVTYGRGEIDIVFWREHLRNRDHLIYLGIDGGIILECILKKSGGRKRTGLIWLRIGTSGWQL